MIKDKLGQILLVLFGALIRDMENNTYYKIQNPGIEATKDEAAESEGTKM